MTQFVLGFVVGRSAVDVLVLCAAAIGACTLIAKTVLKMIRFFQRIEKALVNVEQQLYPNGGSSLRDAVNRIQARLDIPNVTVDAHAPPRKDTP